MVCNGCKELNLQRKSSHPGFVVAFDNIDLLLQRKDMTMSAQNQDVHWVNHEMVINSILFTTVPFMLAIGNCDKGM